MVRARIRLLVASVIAFAAATTQPAQAVTFNLNDVGGAGQGTLARQGFDIATKFWSSVLTDNVTINLNIGFESLGSNILGQTGSNSQIAYLADVYGALAADRTSLLDQSAVAHLPTPQGPDGSVSMVVNNFADPATRSGYTDASQRFDNDGSANNFALEVNTANLRALGITQDAFGAPIDSNPDGTIIFSTDFAFDFDPTDGITTGSSDFIAVAIHEIGHALGFVSGVDTYDIVSGPNSPIIDPDNLPITYAQALELGLLTDDGSSNLEDFALGNTLDLFRYNEAGLLDWSTSDGRKIFSVDGQTAVYGTGAFSLGSFNGDGNQASHWLQPADQSTRDAACSNFLGIMNPYLCRGQSGSISGLDLAAMDAIGWDLAANVRDQASYSFSTADAYRAFASGVPEPATWAELVLGFGLIGAGARRHRRRLAPA
ncbi:PEPxxWA-CTERM sorting domain-containing protein [Sphingomonas sp. AP4-R1]|uniref:NF038122 family metalloprotease n=1 Tax=Sphingomonas sp. AP4-R1 TaxID=2735134 RepID=UPI0014932DB9|nr:NF038122 family metalloprotease [Sphingomonas sp. AP4-R1]QJU57182.1 PEPxxWA-CTERM sorting domain-containing protein [Sphingomonas sp. AP4-R1]